jgi:hypothetical protein
MMRFMRLFVASVGPLVKLAVCPATMWSRQRRSVPASERTSGGIDGSAMLSMSSSMNVAAWSGSSMAQTLRMVSLACQVMRTSP